MQIKLEVHIRFDDKQGRHKHFAKGVTLESTAGDAAASKALRVVKHSLELTLAQEAGVFTEEERKRRADNPIYQ